MFLHRSFLPGLFMFFASACAQSVHPGNAASDAATDVGLFQDGSFDVPGDVVWRAPAGRTLATGLTHACILRADSTVQCWGDNDHGQLGDGTITERPGAVVVLGLRDVVAITAGVAHSCALRGDGTVHCWGRNAQGPVGDGTTTDRLVPNQVEGVDRVVNVFAGHNHTCAVRDDGTVRCWGWNQQGQIGDGTTTDQLRPVRVNGVSNAVQVSGGWFTSIARLRDGTVVQWGEVITPMGGFRRIEMPERVQGLENVVEAEVGYAHTCVRTASNGVLCWGVGTNGVLGTGSSQYSFTAQPVISFDGTRTMPFTGAAQLAMDSYSCARMLDGTVQCWGAFSDPDALGAYFPTPKAGLTNVVELDVNTSACVRLRNGSVRCWGRRAWGAGCCYNGLCGLAEGERCAGGAQDLGVCTNAVCSGCGASGQPCCDPSAPSGRRCRTNTLLCSNDRCVPCGGLGEPCCDTGSRCSSATATCYNLRCAEPGQPGAPCLADNTCSNGCCVLNGHNAPECVARGSSCSGPNGSAGMCAQSGSCGACGGPGQPCCPSSSTRNPYYCSAQRTRCNSTQQCEMY